MLRLPKHRSLAGEMKSSSHQSGPRRSKARKNSLQKPAHSPYANRENIRLPGGGEITLEIGPPGATEDFGGYLPTQLLSRHRPTTGAKFLLIHSATGNDGSIL
jgi:hypothetical protein